MPSSPSLLCKICGFSIDENQVRAGRGSVVHGMRGRAREDKTASCVGIDWHEQTVAACAPSSSVVFACRSEQVHACWCECLPAEHEVGCCRATASPCQCASAGCPRGAPHRSVPLASRRSCRSAGAGAGLCTAALPNPQEEYGNCTESRKRARSACVRAHGDSYQSSSTDTAESLSADRHNHTYATMTCDYTKIEQQGARGPRGAHDPFQLSSCSRLCLPLLAHGDGPPPGPKTKANCPVTGAALNITDATPQWAYRLSTGKPKGQAVLRVGDGGSSVSQVPARLLVTPYDMPLAGADGKRPSDLQLKPSLHLGAINVTMATRGSHKHGQASTLLLWLRHSLLTDLSPMTPQRERGYLCCPHTASRVENIITACPDVVWQDEKSEYRSTSLAADGDNTTHNDAAAVAPCCRG